MRVNTIVKTQFMDVEIWSGIYFSHVGKKSRFISGNVHHFPFQLVSLHKCILKRKTFAKRIWRTVVFFPLSVSKKKLMWKAINPFLGNVPILYYLKAPENFLFVVPSEVIKWEYLLEMDRKAFSSKRIILGSSIVCICWLHKWLVVLVKLFCDLIWFRFP